MTTPGKLQVDAATGHVTGPAHITYNTPWPCANGTPGGGSPSMMGVIMHTMVGNLGSAVAWFNNPASQASAFFGIAEDGSIWQFGPVGHNWEAWAQAAGNPNWYSIEHADAGHPANPLTPQQITASAQLVELLSRFAGFPLQVSDDVNTKGYGWHGMGGVPWGNHPNCPGDVRKAQRPAILALAKDIRNPPVQPPPPPELEAALVLPSLVSRKVLSADGGKTWA